MSKGSTPRPYNKDTFNSNFDSIFGKKEKKKEEVKNERRKNSNTRRSNTSV